METLIEYLTFVKGIGYLLVVGFLLAFLTFWKLLHTKEKEVVKAVPVVVLVWLAFGAASMVFLPGSDNVATAHISEQAVLESAFPEYYSNGSPATAAEPRPVKKLGVNASEYLPTSYGATLNFHQIMGGKVSCRTCHHNSGDEIQSCKNCHDNPFNPENMRKPGLKAAIHTRCINCHGEVFSGPGGCISCHITGVSKSSAVAPSRPHQLTWEDCTGCHKNGIPGGLEIKIVYHDFCVRCHTKGVNGAAKIPADHADRTIDACKGCHKPSAGG